MPTLRSESPMFWLSTGTLLGEISNVESEVLRNAQGGLDSQLLARRSRIYVRQGIVSASAQFSGPGHTTSRGGQEAGLSRIWLIAKFGLNCRNWKAAEKPQVRRPDEASATANREIYSPIQCSAVFFANGIAISCGSARHCRSRRPHRLWQVPFSRHPARSNS
jgi:hypothetical protein